MTLCGHLIRHTKPARLAVLIVLILTGAGLAPAQERNSQLIVVRRRVVIIRSPELVKRFPGRKRAVVEYPVVSGLGDPTVLHKIRSILRVKNIFDYSLRDYRQDQWLDEFTYDVSYNANNIFDITFTQNGVAAYPDSQSRHFAIDLRTGAIIKASDVFRSSELKALATLVNLKMRAELRELIELAKTSPNLAAGEGESIAEALNDMTFEVNNLDDFSVSEKGVTFLYDAGFPHAIEAFAPEGRYLFAYSDLKPYLRSEGLLWQFVR